MFLYYVAGRAHSHTNIASVTTHHVCAVFPPNIVDNNDA